MFQSCHEVWDRPIVGVNTTLGKEWKNEGLAYASQSMQHALTIWETLTAKSLCNYNYEYFPPPMVIIFFATFACSNPRHTPRGPHLTCVRRARIPQI